MSKTCKTTKGTVLPLISLKGKDYLQVAHRLVWFREEEPNSGIETKFLLLEKDSAICQAAITRDGKVVAMATKREDTKGFGDFIEKAETGAIGRALALLGYGTQFTLPDLDEGDRLADSPVSRPESSKAEVKPALAVPAAPVNAVTNSAARKPFNKPAPIAAAKPLSNGAASAAEFD